MLLLVAELLPILTDACQQHGAHIMQKKNINQPWPILDTLKKKSLLVSRYSY